MTTHNRKRLKSFHSIVSIIIWSQIQWNVYWMWSARSLQIIVNLISSNFTNQQNSSLMFRFRVHNSKHSLNGQSVTPTHNQDSTRLEAAMSMQNRIEILKWTNKIFWDGTLEMKIKRTQEAPLSKQRSSKATTKLCLLWASTILNAFRVKDFSLIFTSFSS